MKKLVWMIGVLLICGFITPAQAQEKSQRQSQMMRELQMMPRMVRGLGQPEPAQAQEKSPVEKLWDAISGCREDEVKELCESGQLTTADLNTPDEHDWTPLMWAAGNDRCYNYERLQMVKTLLKQKGIDINHTDKRSGDSALTLAISRRRPGYPLESPLLIEKLREPSHSSIALAILRDAKRNLRKELNVNIADPVELKTALMWAAYYNASDVVRELFKWDNLDVNAQSSDGRTALMYAVYNEQVKKFRSSQGREGSMAVGALQALLENPKVDLNKQDKNGKTALMQSIEIEADATWWIMQLGGDRLDINVQDNAGNTALMYAARKGKGHVVGWILARPDVDVAKKNKEGQTALDLAKSDWIENQIEIYKKKADERAAKADAAHEGALLGKIYDSLKNNTRQN